ncbi:MAG: BON domain-containing protein [Candidatus Kryptoniota bacterium]
MFIRSKIIRNLSIIVSIMTIIGTFVTVSFAQQQKDNNSTIKIFVEYKLAKEGILKNRNVNVMVSNDTITLSGSVPTIYQMKQAEKLAQGVEGSYKVVNELKVSSAYIPDGQLAREVMKKIASHIFYSVFDWVHVSASNGVVTLKGWVHVPWHATEFVSQAERVEGVKKVVNDLKNAMGSEYLQYRCARLIYDDPFFVGYAFEPNPPIHIIVNMSTVILKGKVNSESLKDYIGNQIRFHTDAFDVINDLEVSK